MFAVFNIKGTVFDASAIPADGNTMFKLNGDAFVSGIIMALSDYIWKDKIPFLSFIFRYALCPYCISLRKRCCKWINFPQV